MDVSRITDQLYVASLLDEDHAARLDDLDVDLIISMVGGKKPPKIFTTDTRQVLWLPSFDTFLTPVPMKHLLKGVEAALKVMHRGGRVLVFCREGKRRSVTMAAAILIALGYSAQEAIEKLRAAREVADPLRWYVRRRIKKFEQWWRQHRDRYLQEWGVNPILSEAHRAQS